MPLDDDKTVVENGKGEAPAQQPAKKKGGLMLFGGIGLGAVVVGVALALFVVKPMMSDSGGDSATVEQSEGSHAKETKKPKKSSHGEAAGALIHEINNIVVNPAGTGGSRFLSVSFGFDLESAALAAQFESKEPIIRDALITILSSKTVAQLTDPKEKEIVRYQIRKRLSQLMETDEITGVYYTDFVLQ